MLYKGALVTGISDIVLFIGRLHPLLVHLPIGMIVTLCFLELVARNAPHRAASTSAGYILAFTVPATILATIVGWLLSETGGYDQKLIEWHFWTGLVTAILCSITGLFYLLSARKAYRLCLFATMATLIIASHFGGSLTHGVGYLSRHAPGPFRSAVGNKGGRTEAPANDALLEKSAFAALVEPVFEKNCVPCHGPDKAKGRFRLDTMEHLLKGGAEGPAIVPGRPEASPIVQRMRLPLSDEDHMPPEGKPQPTDEDIAVLEWWIKTGASAVAPASRLDQTPEISSILQLRASSSATAKPGTRQKL